MTAKELKIREVYGDKYDQYEPDKNGWVPIERVPTCKFSEWDSCFGFLRPQELTSIEDNNGWNRIDEVGLPKKGRMYKVLIIRHSTTVIECLMYDSVKWMEHEENMTHWKPIEPEVMPVY